MEGELIAPRSCNGQARRLPGESEEAHGRRLDELRRREREKELREADSRSATPLEKFARVWASA